MLERAGRAAVGALLPSPNPNAAPPDQKRSVSSLMLGEDWSTVNLIPAAEAAAVKTCPGPSCNQAFGLLRRRHHCRLCGMVFCDSCVFRSIQLYIDEMGTAVVRLVAAGQQPMGAVLLRGCAACCDALERSMDFEARGGKPEPLPEPSPEDALLASTCQEMSLQRQKILDKLPAFRDAVLAITETDVDGGGSAGSERPVGRAGSSVSTASTLSAASSAAGSQPQKQGPGAVKLVSLHMADISSLLAEFATGMHLLKVRQRQRLAVHPAAPGHGRSGRQRVADNVAKSMLAFYRDHQREFRILTEDLEGAVPAEVMQHIAREHDVRAVTNVLVILQLCVTESMAFKGLVSIQERLVGAVCTIEGALEALVTEHGSVPWPEHRQLVQGLVRDLAKEKPQIRQYFGKPDWEVLVREKFCRNIESMRTQLEAKGTREQFVGIAATLTTIEKDVNTALAPIDADWEVL